MNKFVECQFEVVLAYEFKTKANSYEDICCASLRSYVILWVLNKSEFQWRHLFSLNLKLCKFMSFKQKRIILNKFVECQFEVLLVYEFKSKANSYEDIGWVYVWSYVCLWVSNKSEFFWINCLSLSLKYCKFMSFKQKLILMKTFLESQFEVMLLYEFQTKAKSYEDIGWASVWSFVSLSVSRKSEFLSRYLLSLSLN